MVEIISILVTIAILTVIIIVPFLVIKTYLAIEKHFIKKDIRDNKYLYEFYLKKWEKRNKYAKRVCYIKKRKQELRDKIHSYYNEILCIPPKDKVSYSEKQIEQMIAYLNKWVAIYEHNWRKQHKIEVSLSRWKKSHSLKTYDEKIIKQFIA